MERLIKTLSLLVVCPVPSQNRPRLNTASAWGRYRSQEPCALLSCTQTIGKNGWPQDFLEQNHVWNNLCYHKRLTYHAVAIHGHHLDLLDSEHSLIYFTLAVGVGQLMIEIYYQTLQLSWAIFHYQTWLHLAQRSRIMSHHCMTMTHSYWALKTRETSRRRTIKTWIWPQSRCQRWHPDMASIQPSCHEFALRSCPFARTSKSQVGHMHMCSTIQMLKGQLIICLCLWSFVIYFSFISLFEALDHLNHPSGSR